MKGLQFLLTFLVALLVGLSSAAQNNSTPLDSALIACYSFSGNANDISGNNNNGTVNGAVLTNDRNGNPNSAYSFNGANQNIVVPGFSSEVTSTEFSISFWATASGYATRSAIIMDPDDPANRLNVHVYYGPTGGPGQTFWDFGDISTNGRLYISTQSLPPNNTWDHWVFVVSGKNGGFMKGYKNGNLIGSQTGNGTYSNTILKNLMIGGGYTGGYYLWFDGSLDDIKIYRRFLTQNDVTQLYTTTLSCVCLGPAGPVNTTGSACANQSATLSVTSTQTVSWYANSNLNPVIGNGTSFTTPVLSQGTYTYYAVATNSCQGVSPSTPVVLTVNPTSSVSIGGNTFVCSGQSTVLNATLTGSGTINWYASPTLSTVVGTGTTYQTPALATGSHTYYVMVNAVCPPKNAQSFGLTVSECTGLPGYSVDASTIDVYPNPSNGDFKIRASNLSGDLAVAIFNVMGELIDKVILTSDRPTWSLEGYSKGTYIVKVSRNGALIGNRELIVR